MLEVLRAIRKYRDKLSDANQGLGQKLKLIKCCQMTLSMMNTNYYTVPSNRFFSEQLARKLHQ
jgi:hypothetical protein